MRNVGVIIAPRLEQQGFPQEGSDAKRQPSIGATLKKVGDEGVKRARLLTYGATEIREAAVALGSGAKIAVSIPDLEVNRAGQFYEFAEAFCTEVSPFVSAGTVDLVVVGVTPPSGVGADVARMASLANATRNIARACRNQNATVPVSTCFSLSVLRSSFPPSQSLFAAPGPLIPILTHLRDTKAPFVIEIDPYLAWRQSYYDISLDYALFGLEPPGPPEFVDPLSGVSYWNLFDAMVDAVRWALFRERFGDLQVVVGSVGWPSGWLPATTTKSRRPSPPGLPRPEDAANNDEGDQDPQAAEDGAGATLAHAARFNSRLASHMNCTHSAVPTARLDLDGCAATVAYVYQADDPPPATGSNTFGGTLRWGICAYTGNLKYSLRTGAVLVASMSRSKDRGPCDPLCLAHAISRARKVVLIAVASVVLLLVFFLIKKDKRRKLFRRHSADSVATVIRSARFAAQENLQNARANTLNSHYQKTLSTRFFGGSTQPTGLRAIAESVYSDDDAASLTHEPASSKPVLLNGNSHHHHHHHHHHNKRDCDDDAVL
ncbi:hypothetical protein CTAYLR_002189 [Chrysophaeum taylorii]|uniref:Uncharacterized protein n=1 Tax=Chrysophaeum taylorii TaxID=2483200 RepID=A0AAD7UPW4_9STRA|nr:hypothetical protein CTAYLR_002189 [Chrysophaeum taylorii]